ncbi:HlyC/CorC family transporter [candidate division KSB1 bacterium]|nr:HlyC/CorC family transporter [candidate division KSB1 bacterium]RQW07316.1 MAG: HlyC/CorC family transporter [candidate division KSB1 bacterium]
MLTVESLLFLLTLLLSAFFSGSETAYISANRLKIRLSHRDDDKIRSGARVLVSDQRFLSTILVGNNIVMVACSSLAVVVFSSFVNDALLVSFTTLFLLLFGEILPKSIAAQMPNLLLRLSIKVLALFYFLFYPLIWLAERLSTLLVRAIGRQTDAALFSRADLLVLVREYSSRSDFTAQNHKLLARALRFRDKRLWDIMVPRTEIYGVEKDDSLEVIRAMFTKSGYSRLPAYDGDLDNIVGFFYAWDFIEPFDERPPVRPAMILPESTKVTEALHTLQRANKSIAIAVDEHGGTAGLVTIEDIVEKLVGAIADEFDYHPHTVKSTGDAAFIVDGKTSVDELRERFDIKLPDGDYVTIAGLIMHALGRIPQTGESIDFTTFKLKVLEASETRIIKVWITKKPKQMLH